MVTIKTPNNEKILSCAVSMLGNSYYRNRYMFNVSLVLDDTKKSSPFVSITRKIVKFLMDLELKDTFLSERDQTNELQTFGASSVLSESVSMNLVSGVKHDGGDMKNREKLYEILKKMYDDINVTGGTHQQCSDDFALSAYIGTFRQKPKLPNIYQVPFLWLHHQHEAATLINGRNYDISTQKFLRALKEYPMERWWLGQGRFWLPTSEKELLRTNPNFWALIEKK